MKRIAGFIIVATLLFPSCAALQDIMTRTEAKLSSEEVQEGIKDGVVTGLDYLIEKDDEKKEALKEHGKEVAVEVGMKVGTAVVDAMKDKAEEESWPWWAMGGLGLIEAVLGGGLLLGRRKLRNTRADLYPKVTGLERRMDINDVKNGKTPA
jgi:hypothetical protein